MSSVVESMPHARAAQAAATVTKKKKNQDDGGRPINFRAPSDLAARLDAVAEGLGLDVSNLVRMVLYENLHEYEQRVERLRKGEGDS